MTVALEGGEALDREAIVMEKLAAGVPRRLRPVAGLGQKPQRPGVSAKGAQAAPGLTTREWEEVRLEDIDVADRTFQYRFPTNIGDLRTSLLAEGQREPIDLMGKRPYRIIDGFRRTAAVQELGWTTIKAFVHRRVLDEEAFRLAFTKNVVRRNLSPMERANAMFLAQQRGVKKAELAGLFSLSEKQVGRYLELLDFPEAVQKVLDGKVVTMAAAKALADFQVQDAEAWRKRIQEELLDARALRRLLKKELGKKATGRPRTYLRRERDGLRMYPWAIRSDAAPAEKERLRKVLEEALRWLST